jgi:hypothetical protein
MLNSTMNVELIAIIIAAPTMLLGGFARYYLAKEAYIRAAAAKAAAEASAAKDAAEAAEAVAEKAAAVDKAVAEKAAAVDEAVAEKAAAVKAAAVKAAAEVKAAAVKAAAEVKAAEKAAEKAAADEAHAEAVQLVEKAHAEAVQLVEKVRAEGITNNVCNTENDCKKLAESLGLQIGGGGFSFAGPYETKGLYSYNSGKYAGMAFFGRGGTEEQMKASVHGQKYRPVPCTSEDDCKKIAESLGLQLGGCGYDFAGPYETKGLYSYNSGKYAGMAFFGRGGTEAQMKASVHGQKYRPGYGRV